MTLFLNCLNLSKYFGIKQLFQDLNLSIFENDRIGLIGPNGSGKSTLLKIIKGLEDPNTDTISLKKGINVGYVPQSQEFPDLIPKALLIDAFPSHLEDYEKEYQADMMLSKLGFTGNEPNASHLSGGWKKRLSIGLSLITKPDLLLLDEPTNHLDLDGILWLEKFLTKEAKTYILVSHDRYFLQHMTNRIVEIDKVYPGGVFSINGAYKMFLEKKEEFIAGQLQHERAILSKARREQEWLRTSPKARTTKSQSRIDSAHELLSELSDVKQRNKQTRADIDFSATERETQKLLSAKNLSKSMGNKTLFKNLDFLLSPGTRIGLLGSNGSGKTTLLKILNGELEADAGTIKKADGLQIVYFDQHRVKLPLNITLREALSPTGDFVTYRGHPIHVNGWCKRFLFSPHILDMPLSELSGGERARISIAHLMLKPADILLLDEPTNDLDIPTLETLEETLLEFPGAVVLITHDRCMMDRICNQYLKLGETPKEEEKEAPKSAPKAQPKGKLSYLEKKDYEQMEEKIGLIEKEIQELSKKLEGEQDPSRLQEICSTIGLKETQIEQLYLRWEELESKIQKLDFP